MPSIDALTAAIGAVLDQIRLVLSHLGASHRAAEELRDELRQLGVEEKARQAAAIADGLKQQQTQAAALAQQAETALAHAEALRGEGGASGGGAPPGPPSTPAPPPPPEPSGPPGYPHNKPHEISWSDLLHVCHGDEDDEESGGHLAGTGRPGKTEFPVGWDDEDVREALVSVAERPHTTERARPGMWRATGTHRGIAVQVMVRDGGGIEAGWPIQGPGVHRNPPMRRR